MHTQMKDYMFFSWRYLKTSSTQAPELSIKICTYIKKLYIYEDGETGVSAIITIIVVDNNFVYISVLNKVARGSDMNATKKVFFQGGPLIFCPIRGNLFWGEKIYRRKNHRVYTQKEIYMCTHMMISMELMWTGCLWKFFLCCCGVVTYFMPQKYSGTTYMYLLYCWGMKEFIYFSLFQEKKEEKKWRA